MPHGLSKSRYIQFKACPKGLWLSIYKPEDAVVDDSTKARFSVGHQVGELAKGLLGPFVDMTVEGPDGHPLYNQMIEKTKFALKDGAENICEAAFNFAGNYCAVDILHKTNKGYEIYEVKSSTDADKEIYAWDVAFQKYVLTGCGLNVVGTYLVCINNQYVRQGELEIKKLFKINDISVAVDEEYEEVASNIEEAKKVLEGSEPDIPVSCNCNNPYACAFWDYCAQHIPSPSVFDLYRMNGTRKWEYYDAGMLTFEDIKDEYLTPIQRMLVDCTLSGTEFIDKDGIRDFLDMLSYPLYFLDFESVQPVIPLYDGTWPYQQLPTQYSLHYQLEKGGKLYHKEFLAPSRENPLRPIAESLCRDIPDDVCVLVYNKAFECTRMRELADMFPDLADHLMAIRENVADLLVPFRSGCYYLPSMGGSFSIKSVLPALYPDDPDLDYHGLSELCQNGGDAMNLFLELQYMSPEDGAIARKALLDYCKLDTLALVKVLEKLYEVTA